MVAVIKTGHSVKRIVLYNENKVKEGVAICLHAENYPMNSGDMNEHQRLNMLLKTAEKNSNVERNSVHISLNFAIGENLSPELLKQITREYMEIIGFGEQPYLVYEHHDAGHPHIHIATVKVRPDGSRIDMQNIGKTKSQEARILLEKKYGLVQADAHKREVFKMEPVSVAKVKYGKTATKRAMQNVLAYVLEQYKFTSLPELNAVLGMYNITADRGSEDSRIYKNNGLVYRVLDEQGNKTGVPIKASDFYLKPTLKNLEKQFLRNDVGRQKHTKALKSAIDFEFAGNRRPTLSRLIQQLKSKGIRIVLRENKDGLMYGLTYVDHRTKCVFNGSALGKNYSAKAILERCAVSEKAKNVQHSDANSKNITKENTVHSHTDSNVEQTKPSSSSGNDPSVLEILTAAEETYSHVPYELRKKKKKKRKGISK